jgi:hypothetical protein
VYTRVLSKNHDPYDQLRPGYQQCDLEQNLSGFALQALRVQYKKDDIGKRLKEGSDNQRPSEIHTH